MKATALSKAGRNDEALQEYFLCVALKPDWTKVKLEAQKVIFLSISELKPLSAIFLLNFNPVPFSL